MVQELDTSGPQGPLPELGIHARISDVAAQAGVSVSTVSNVLNNPTKVQRETLTLVSQVMRDLQYIPNAHAVALRRGSKISLQSNTVSEKQ